MSVCAPINGTRKQTAKLLPEWYILAIWLSTFLSAQATCGLIFKGSTLDHIMSACAGLLCLPFLSPRVPNSTLLIVGFLATGLIVGLQVIDLVFDIVVLQDTVLIGSQDNWPARKAAWMYYRNIVSAPHVNASVILVCSLCFLGALTAITRSSPHAWRQWLFCVATMCVGNGAYAFVILPHYVQIRLQPEYNPALFDAWTVVAAARAVNLIAMLFSWPAMAVLLRDDILERSRPLFKCD